MTRCTPTGSPEPCSSSGCTLLCISWHLLLLASSDSTAKKLGGVEGKGCQRGRCTSGHDAGLEILEPQSATPAPAEPEITPFWHNQGPFIIETAQQGLNCSDPLCEAKCSDRLPKKVDKSSAGSSMRKYLTGALNSASACVAAASV